MSPMAPNFVSVRLTEEDKQNFVKVADAAERAVGIRLSTADVYRLGIKALAEKHNVKGVK